MNMFMIYNHPNARRVSEPTGWVHCPTRLNCGATHGAHRAQCRREFRLQHQNWRPWTCWSRCIYTYICRLYIHMSIYIFVYMYV